MKSCKLKKFRIFSLVQQLVRQKGPQALRVQPNWLQDLLARQPPRLLPAHKPQDRHRPVSQWVCLWSCLRTWLF